MIPQFRSRVYTQNIRKQGLEQISVPHIHSNIIHNGQNVEATQVSFNRWMHKYSGVYTQWNMIQPLKLR